MSGGPKKWVSSKVRGKSSSRLKLSGGSSSHNLLSDSPHHSDSSFAANLPLDLDHPPPSPPARLPTTAATAATSIDDSDTAFIECGGGSSSAVSRTATTLTTAMTGTTPPAHGSHSNSSLSTHNDCGTPSPSTTPPKKTWERNYKSFLRWSGKQPGGLLSHSLSLAGRAGSGNGNGAVAISEEAAAASVSVSASASASVSAATTTTIHHGVGPLAKFHISKSDPAKNSPKTNSSSSHAHASCKPKFPFPSSSSENQQPSLPDLTSSHLPVHGKMMPSLLPPPRTLSENNATAHLRKQRRQDPSSSELETGQRDDGDDGDDFVMDLGPSLVEGFSNPMGNHTHNHQNHSKENNHNSSSSTSSNKTSLFKSVFRHKLSNHKLHTPLDDSGHHSHRTAHSISSASSSASRLRSKAKSSDALDSTMRRGVDRKSGVSPSTTPPGSNSSIASQSPRNPSPASSSSVGGTPVGTPGKERLSTQEEGEVRAAVLSRLVHRQLLEEEEEEKEQERVRRYWQPSLPHASMPHPLQPLPAQPAQPAQQPLYTQQQPQQSQQPQQQLPVARRMTSEGDLYGANEAEAHQNHHNNNHNNHHNNSRNKDTLDQARHRGHALSSDGKHHLFSRVSSMGSNLTIREGHEGVVVANHNPDPNPNMDQPHPHTTQSLSSASHHPHPHPRPMHNRSTTMGIPGYLHAGPTPETQRWTVVNAEEEALIRERKKAFTDFHNMGIDSSSAYLGDDPSLHHKHSSMFLSSMAYPAGSAGGKVRTRPTHGIHGPHSLDQRRVQFVESTSLSALTMTPHLNETGDVAPERALRPLEGPEQWKKAERHAIIPAVLCMCPIRVLNHILSSEERGMERQPPSHPGTVGGSGGGGYGIGSIIAEDDGSAADNDGWFFGEHHHPIVTTGMSNALSSHSYTRGGAKSNVPSSAFGKIVLGKATVAALGMRSFLGEVYGWCTGVFVLRQNYLFEYREHDSVNGLPWGYAMLQLAEVYPHKHFTNALHLDFFERPCSKSGKRSLLIRVESKEERDRWVSLLHSAARMTIHDLYDVDESESGAEFGRGRYAVVRPAKRRVRMRGISFSETRYPHVSSHDTFRSASSTDSLNGWRSSNNDLSNAGPEYDCALKIIDKQEFWSRVRKDTERADTLVREAAVQTTLAVQGADTPGFLRLRNIFETGEQLVLELELLKGTDLFQHISSRGVLDEVEAAHIMRDLLTCLSVMDQIGIAHRDIKPANLLMCDEESEGTRVKLADYGMSSFVGVDNLVRGRCGTPGFVAPEIFLTGVNGGYGNKVDMYSAGVTLYVMLAGYEPFYGESDTELINANKEAKVDFPHAEWHSVSIEGRDLIERMLVVDPAKRIGPNEALRHPWITRRAPRNTPTCNDS